MKQFLFFILITGSLVSCAPENIGRQAVVPASISNVQTPEGEFNIITSLLILEDSVLTWTDCSKQRVLNPNSIEGESTYYDQWTCNTPYQWYKLYKGVLITDEGDLIEVGFLSTNYLSVRDLKQNNNGTYIKVRTLNNIQVKKVPGYELQKVFIYE